MKRFYGRFTGAIKEPWQMYPLGMLFGLGFDTATEVALLFIAAGAAGAGLPFYAILCLPILFAAGMSLLDTIDGSFMNLAYGRAFSKPVQKVFYNITIIGLSIAIALIVGTIELLGLIVTKLNLKGEFWIWVSQLNMCPSASRSFRQVTGTTTPLGQAASVRRRAPRPCRCDSPVGHKSGPQLSNRARKSQQMQIRARLSMSADGYVTTPEGWPAQLADPAFISGQSHGIQEFLEGCEAALMGRTTFEPALSNDRWPWPNLDVLMLGSTRPPGAPDHVVSDSDPARLLEKLRAANQGGDVHLVGGPRTIETFRALGALDKLELVVLPLLLEPGCS